ncbi:MAG: protein-disulfide reductase DsbD domain-containing protein [Hyphomicrobiales bacterium]
MAQALSGPWVELPNAKARLVVTGDPMSGYLQAGLEIELEEDWKTYWRFPGDSGIPPTLDWSNAANVADAKLRFPAPQRFKDEYGQSVGYKHSVVFPIDIKLARIGRPTQLEVDAILGICREVCIPVTERFSLKVPPIFVTSQDAKNVLAKANTSVPAAYSDAETDAQQELSIETFERYGTTPLLSIRVPLDLEIMDVFVEGPETWFLTLPKKGPSDQTHQLWQLPLDGTPVGKDPWGAKMRVTMVGTAHAFEQEFTLDAPR